MATAYWLRVLRRIRIDWEAVAHYSLLIVTGAAVLAEVSRCLGG